MGQKKIAPGTIPAIIRYILNASTPGQIAESDQTFLTGLASAHIDDSDKITSIIERIRANPADFQANTPEEAAVILLIGTYYRKPA